MPRTRRKSSYTRGRAGGNRRQQVAASLETMTAQATGGPPEATATAATYSTSHQVQPEPPGQSQYSAPVPQMGTETYQVPAPYEQFANPGQHYNVPQETATYQANYNTYQQQTHSGQSVHSAPEFQTLYSAPEFQASGQYYTAPQATATYQANSTSLPTSFHTPYQQPVPTGQSSFPTQFQQQAPTGQSSFPSFNPNQQPAYLGQSCHTTEETARCPDNPTEIQVSTDACSDYLKHSGGYAFTHDYFGEAVASVHVADLYYTPASSGEVGGYTLIHPHTEVVKFDSAVTVRGVATQGRWRNESLPSCCDERVTAFRIDYSLDCMSEWTFILVDNGRIFEGNVIPDAGNEVVENMFDAPVTAKCFTLLDNDYHVNRVIRWDLIGCADVL